MDLFGLRKLSPYNSTFNYCRGWADPEGSEFDNDSLIIVLYFLVDEELEDPNTTINGPSSARQRNAI